MNKKKKNANKKLRKNQERMKKLRLVSMAKAKKPVAKKIVETNTDAPVKEVAAKKTAVKK